MESSTTRAQRIGIWIIAIALVVGTLFGFLAMIISSDTENKAQKALADYQRDYQEFAEDSSKQQEELDKRAPELAKDYQKTVFDQKSRVAKFKNSDVKKLDVRTLRAGKGEKITDDTTYAAYYIGWNEKAKIFDSSIIDDKKLKSPLIVRPGSVIKGWSEGMKGLRIGGVYQLSIPSNKAYGDQEQGEDIPANSSLKFVVVPVEKLETLKEPKATQEIVDAYGLQ
ncbi:FKBP-type peptidyl-prolyl cis-trans isomerase [Candidatus Nomurabacteria bacterium]|nr:FKBP-type peptidyl-prolyl cis-trans isomerase [Candidatus Nomurabacteria bacterium]